MAGAGLKQARLRQTSSVGRLPYQRSALIMLACLDECLAAVRVRVAALVRLCLGRDPEPPSAVQNAAGNGAEVHSDSDWNDSFDSFINFSLHGRQEQRGPGKKVMQRVGMGSSTGLLSQMFGGSFGSTKASSSEYELVRTQLDGLSGIAASIDDDDLLF